MDHGISIPVMKGAREQRICKDGSTAPFAARPSMTLFHKKLGSALHCKTGPPVPCIYSVQVLLRTLRKL